VNRLSLCSLPPYMTLLSDGRCQGRTRIPANYVCRTRRPRVGTDGGGARLGRRGPPHEREQRRRRVAEQQPREQCGRVPFPKPRPAPAPAIPPASLSVGRPHRSVLGRVAPSCAASLTWGRRAGNRAGGRRLPLRYGHERRAAAGSAGLCAAAGVHAAALRAWRHGGDAPGRAGAHVGWVLRHPLQQRPHDLFPRRKAGACAALLRGACRRHLN
jgi:hypothetical protein